MKKVFALFIACGWSCTATRAFPASTVQMSGMFIEPTDYVEYSVDKLIQ